MWYPGQSAAEQCEGRTLCTSHVRDLRHGDKVFETYWTNGRGVEAMNNSYALLDMTIYGRQEWWEDNHGWPEITRA